MSITFAYKQVWARVACYLGSLKIHLPRVLSQLSGECSEKAIVRLK